MIPVANATAAVLAASEAPNPILPITAEIVWTAIAFLLLTVLLRMSFPKVADTMDTRADKVRDDLAAAERARASIGEVQAGYHAAIAAARAEASRILDAARAEGDAERAEVLGRKSVEVAARRSEAATEVEAQRSAVLTQLADPVVEVTVASAERVLGRPVDAAQARSVVQELIDGGAR